MANYITAAEFTIMTQVTGEQCGEVGAGTTKRDAEITKAQVEFEREIRNTFDGTEVDYSTGQEALAFLVAHRFAIKNMPLVTDSPMTSPYLKEYTRLVKLLKKTETTVRDRIWSPTMGTTETSATVDDRYSA